MKLLQGLVVLAIIVSIGLVIANSASPRTSASTMTQQQQKAVNELEAEADAYSSEAKAQAQTADGEAEAKAKAEWKKQNQYSVQYDVANEMVARWDVVKNSPTARQPDRCAALGLVVEAYLRAHDDDEYRHWQQIERDNECN
jgi:type II secretory pathway pseudopilin PulG